MPPDTMEEQQHGVERYVRHKSTSEALADSKPGEDVTDPDLEGNSIIPGRKPRNLNALLTIFKNSNPEEIIPPKLKYNILGQAGKGVSVEVDDLLENQAIIAVMGPTGSGKSSFIATATGADVRIGHDLHSSTTSIGIVKFQCLERSDLDIVLVDTPGFDDTHKTDIEILEMLADWLKTTYQRKITLAGILYFHRISDNRIAGTPLKNLRMFQELCGRKALRNVVLVTTMWGEVDADIGSLRETELKKKYWKVMIDEGSATARYRNTRSSAWDILDYIIQDANDRKAVLLQKEMVDMRRQLPETSAGQELYRTLDALVKLQQDLLQNIRAETKREADQNILLVLKAEAEIVRKQLDVAISAVETLKLPLSKRLLHLLRSSFGDSVRRNWEDSDHRDLVKDSLIGRMSEIDLAKNQVIIALIGCAGAGKSEFIYKATGLDNSVGHGLGAGSAKISRFKASRYERCDLDVIFLDTPGFDGTRTDKEVVKSLTAWLNTTYGRKVTLDGLLYFHKISERRWNSRETPGVDMFDELCGKNAQRKVILVTTMWDDARQEQAKQEEKEKREKELREKHWKAMIDKGSSIVRYERTFNSAWSVLRPFIQAANRRQTDLVQQEIADMRKQQRKSKAAQALYTKLEDLVKSWHDLRQRIRAEIDRPGDEEIMKTLKAQYEENRKQLARTIIDIRNMKLPLGTYLFALLRAPTIQ